MANSTEHYRSKLGQKFSFKRPDDKDADGKPVPAPRKIGKKWLERWMVIYAGGWDGIADEQSWLDKDERGVYALLSNARRGHFEFGQPILLCRRIGEKPDDADIGPHSLELRKQKWLQMTCADIESDEATVKLPRA